MRGREKTERKVRKDRFHLIDRTSLVHSEYTFNLVYKTQV